MIQERKPILYVMVGLSASGKSTIAKEIAEKNNAEIVSTDAIRGEICPEGVSDQSMNEEVFKIFHKRICGNLMADRNVIADATNITMKSRRAIFEAIKNIECYKIAYVMTKEFINCFIDNSSREYPVPRDVLYRQMNKFQIPFIEEGFDEIVIHKTKPIDISTSFFFDIAEKMNGFDQKNPHHTLDLLTHCSLAKDKFKKKIGYLWSEYPIAAGLHDVGKLFTQTFDVDDMSVAHYYRHENVGSYYLLSHEQHFRAIGYTDEELLNILFLVNYHMMPFSWTSKEAHKKWKRRFGDNKYKLLIDFNKCDINAK